MLRDRWDFEFTAAKLSLAATKKKAHHAERLKFWEDAKAGVMKEVRETGIEVSESMAANYGNTSSRAGPQVMVRNDLQTKLTECHQKIQEHSGRIKEYEGWVQVLSGNPEAKLKLHADDYLFFFGA